MTEPVRPPRPGTPPVLVPVFDEDGNLTGWTDPATGDFIPYVPPVDTTDEDAVQSEE